MDGGGKEIAPEEKEERQQGLILYAAFGQPCKSSDKLAEQPETPSYLTYLDEQSLSQLASASHFDARGSIRDCVGRWE